MPTLDRLAPRMIGDRGTNANDTLRADSTGTFYDQVKNTATASAPTVNDDSGDGYVAGVNGSRWLNTATGIVYVCTSASVGAAVWAPDAAPGGTYQPADAFLTSIAALGTAADKVIYTTGVDTAAETALTAAARTVLDDASVADMVTTLGGASSTGTGGLVRATSPTLVTPALGTPASGTLTNCSGLPTTASAASQTDIIVGRATAGAGATEEIVCTAAGRALLDDASAQAQLITLGGQPLDAFLTSIAALGTAADKVVYTTGVDTAAETGLTAAARTVLDDASVGDMVNTLGGATSVGTGGLVRESAVTMTLGPFFVPNMAASASTRAGVGVFTGATTVSAINVYPKIQASGTVIGMIIVSSEARTAGTLTGKVSIDSGAGESFAGDAVVLDATNTTSDSAFVTAASGNGVDIVAGETVTLSLTSSSWAPTTADITGWLVVQLD